ncbi:MAG TPA: hypothetical protein VF909_09050 [Roseiflexaceae bacterium]
MPAADEQILRALERRLALVLNAPPKHFSSELASYLEFLSRSVELRAVVTAVLRQEVEEPVALQDGGAATLNRCAVRMSEIAHTLALMLHPWLVDDTLPSWVGPLLESYDERRALAAIERGESAWGALRSALESADLCAGEVAELLREADDAEARGLALRLAQAREAGKGITSSLARLWGHVRHSAPKALLPEWSQALGAAADRVREQSSTALLRQALLAPQGDGDSELRAALGHDLRRLTAALTDALEARPPALPAFERFRLWCELYEREALLRRVRPGKKATETLRRRKRGLISAEALRYLYAQGFTPFTFEMLEGEGTVPTDLPHPLLVEVRVIGEREELLRGYVACVQALRSSEWVRRLGLREVFLLAFLVEPAARFVEPAPITLGGVLLRSLFVELTPSPSGGRQPLGIEAIVARIAEEDRLLDFLNTASEDALDSVAGVGPAKIQQIIAGRPYGGATDLRRAGLPTAGGLYEALRARALRGMQTLVTG